MSDDFLTWLGGYFDHGGCCRVYKRMSWGYLHLDVHIVITGTKETVEYIKNHYYRWNAQIKKRRGTENSWVFVIQSIAEALFFCEELLPYSKFRRQELEEVIEMIRGWAKR